MASVTTIFFGAGNVVAFIGNSCSPWLQNLPALVLKIMQAAAGISPIPSRYSEGLRDLINSMLQRNPDDRPNIENIMANPVVVNILVNLGTDVGRLPCTR